MPTHRKCDLTNMLEAVDDILVGASVLQDDNFTIVQSHDGSRVMYDKEHPRTEVYIAEAEAMDAAKAAEVRDCYTCAHSAVCELWYEQERQRANCYSESDECKYYAPFRE
jgi:hypothetical protein